MSTRVSEAFRVYPIARSRSVRFIVRAGVYSLLALLHLGIAVWGLIRGRNRRDVGLLRKNTIRYDSSSPWGKSVEYLLYDEVNDITASRGAFLGGNSTICSRLLKRYGIDVYEDLSSAKAALAAADSAEPTDIKEEPAAEDGDLDLSRREPLRRPTIQFACTFAEMGTGPLADAGR